MWDPESGYFVANKSPIGHSVQSGASPGAKNDTANGASTSSTPSSANESISIKNGPSNEQQQLATETPPLSSSTSAASTSNGTKANGTKHYTRSRGSSKKSTSRKSQNGYSSGVSVCCSYYELNASKGSYY
jgi:hypothetical protein